MKGSTFVDQLLVVGIVVIVLAVGIRLGAVSGATLQTEPGVRPFLVDCKRCSRETVKRTGNVSDGNPIISQRVRCTKCTVEFREDLICLPSPIPQPQP